MSSGFGDFVRGLHSGAMNLEARDPRNKAEQIADDMREQIDSGAWPEGSRIPTAVELVEHYGASNQTIQNATALLREEGSIKRSGRSLVVSSTSERKAHKSLDSVLDLLSTLKGDIDELKQRLTKLEDQIQPDR